MEALEDGTVVGYWYNDESDSGIYDYNRLPAFPKLDAQKAKAAAQGFLDKVLDGRTETVELEDPASANQLGSTNCWFSGKILLNGLPSPLSYYINVRGSDNAVTSFHRDAPAVSFLGNIPSPTPAVTQEKAGALLRDKLELELAYVTDEADASHAVLRYLPRETEPWYVDAQSGELVQPEPVTYYSTNSSMATAEVEEAAMDAGGVDYKRTLTQVELEGVEKLEGVLDRDSLDKALREESAYQLEGFTLAAANYRLVEEGEGEEKTEKVLCTLRYTAQEEEAPLYSRSFTLDARTTQVQSASYSRRWRDDCLPVAKGGG